MSFMRTCFRPITVHFFDPESLEVLLKRNTERYFVERSDPILSLLVSEPFRAFLRLRFLFRLGLLKPKFFTRLYAVASVREN